MAKPKLESGAQVRTGHQDGAWNFTVYGPKPSVGETGGHVASLQSYATFDDTVAAIRNQYDV